MLRCCDAATLRRCALAPAARARARAGRYAADLVNGAYASAFFGAHSPRLPLKEGGVGKADMVAVSTMEGSGWMEVLALEEVSGFRPAHLHLASRRKVFHL